jgi:hypothetical protein
LRSIIHFPKQWSQSLPKFLQFTRFLNWNIICFKVIRAVNFNLLKSLIPDIPITIINYFSKLIDYVLKFY